MSAGGLPQAWVDALRQVERRRSMLHYKPAALLTALQMLDDGVAVDGRVPYSEYQQRFRRLLAPIDPKGASQAWEPFFHLATGSQVWRLYRAGTPVDVAPEDASESFVANRVDEAVFQPELVEFANTPEGRRAVRIAVLDMLATDAAREGDKGARSQMLLSAVAPEFISRSPRGPRVTDFEVGQIYDRRVDIHGRFGGQAQGGISTPAGGAIIFLFMGDSGKQYGYKDGWSKESVFLYTGERQTGDMEFRGGNKAIRDHIANGKDLLLFESLGKGLGYCYRGQFACASWEYRNGPDVNGTERKVIVFHLIQSEQQTAPVEPPVLAPTATAPSLDELRSKAMQASAPAPQMSAREARHLYYQRSEAVRRYVLARAAGICEACATNQNLQAPQSGHGARAPIDS